MRAIEGALPNSHPMPANASDQLSVNNCLIRWRGGSATRPYHQFHRSALIRMLNTVDGSLE